MKIRQLMTREVEACAPATDLAAVAMMMWRNDCGIIPIVDERRRVLGVVTDRDICMATATRHRRPEELRAEDATSGKVYSVHAEEDVREAFKAMRSARVRRLPVVDEENRLQGIVSMNDIVLHTKALGAGASAEPSANSVLTTLQAICEHPGASASTARAEALVATHA